MGKTWKVTFVSTDGYKRRTTVDFKVHNFFNLVPEIKAWLAIDGRNKPHPNYWEVDNITSINDWTGE